MTARPYAIATSTNNGETATTLAGRYAREGNARRSARALRRRLIDEGQPGTRVYVVRWYDDAGWIRTWEADPQPLTTAITTETDR